MTESNGTLSDIAALLDERRRYEGWLAALEARRELTPQHVFDRVHADYRTRLQSVAERLASHRSAIDTERGNVQQRLALLTAEERLRRDERAELELRAHVGELNGAEGERAFAAVDDAISRLSAERQSLDQRMAELVALLANEPHPIPATPASRPPAEPIAPPLVSAPTQVSEVAANRPAAVAPPAPPPVAPTGPRPSFDELAFLSSVVGAQQPDGPLVERRPTDALSLPAGAGRAEPPSTSLLAGVENARLAGGQVPLAANVAENNPLVVRSAAVTEPTKTLKCTECGSMNYPTEWYCERCGAELAAL